MTKARDIADFKFEDIVDTGTEGTKVASGTTAQRGSTTGQWRYNTTTGFFEGRNTDGTFSSLEPQPTIISTDVTDIETSLGGNVTIRVTGTNFTSGATIKFIANDGTQITASTSTFINASNYDAVVARSSFSNSLEPYDVRYVSASGLTATLDDNINVDNSPTWNTTSGTLATISDQSTGTHATLSATDPDGDTVSYSDTTGNLVGAGLTLNSSTGVISGDPTDISSSTTVSFTGRATAGSKGTNRSFNIIIDPYRDVQFALLGAGGGGGSQDSSYQNGNDENQGEGGCGSLITATYVIKLGTTIYYYVGTGGEGGVNSSGGNSTTYGGDGGAGASGAGDGVAGGEGGNLTGIFMGNAISNTNALLIAGAGGGAAGRPAGGGRDESNGGGGIENSSGEGNDGTLGHQWLENGLTNDLPQGGNKNAGGAVQSQTPSIQAIAGTAGSNFYGGTGGYASGAWGMGGGGGAGLYGGGGGSSSGGWGGNGGGAGSSFVRGLITDYTDTNLNNNFATGITYSTGAFTTQSYGHTGGALSGQDSGSGRGYNGNTSYSMREPASFSSYIGSLTLTDYGYGGNTGYNDTKGETGKQGIIAYKIGTGGSWQQLTTTDTLTSLSIS
jgi:hypothetical protein